MHITKLDETASALLAATMAIDVIVLFRICTLRIMRTYIVRSSPMQSTKSANTEKKMELHYDFVAHMRICAQPSMTVCPGSECNCDGMTRPSHRYSRIKDKNLEGTYAGGVRV